MALSLSRIQTLLQSQDPQINSIKDLEEILGVSPETLRKSFRRENGISLHPYITMTKVQSAKELLLSTDLHCSEILGAVGFRREDSGGRTFERLVGLTMQVYRECGASLVSGTSRLKTIQHTTMRSGMHLTKMRGFKR